MSKSPDTLPTAAAARPISFCAVPDRGEAGVKIKPGGMPKAVMPNLMAMPLALRAELTETTRELWHPWQPGARLPAAPWIINHCADADEYRSGLIWLDETYGATAPIFNHPRAVARSRRDHSSAALQGIVGLTVPRVARFRATSRAALERCFEENGFHFPVLVRPSGGQTGRGLLKIEGPQHWDRALNTMWFGQPHFMTEFVDFATSEGLYLKARVLFVADRFFVRHVKAATGWKVHNDTASSITDFKERELELIRDLNENAAFGRACQAIPARTGLDFCGMDVGVDLTRNRFVMFECNAAMTVFFKRSEAVDDERQARRDLLEAPASTAFEQHLRAPHCWVWRNSPLSQGANSLSCRQLLSE
jgi:glutathione synthase/RimK-type ligase-like ATP-grasp enzyme